MENNNTVELVLNALNGVINTRFNHLVASTADHASVEAERASVAIRQFLDTLNETQRVAYIQMEMSVDASHVADMERFFSLGFYDGLSAGRAII